MGTLIPHIFCTQRDKDQMMNYYENMTILCKEEIIMMPGEKRADYAENSLTWIDPRSVANPKLNRRIYAHERNMEGTKENCVEMYKDVWVGTEICSGKEWRGDGGEAKKLVLKKFQEENPDIPIKGHIKGIQHQDELSRFRDGSERIADVRVGQDYSRPGRAYIIIRTGEYKGEFSFYNYDGELFSTKTIIEGKIHVEAESGAAA
jgi:hypothetical protein